MKELLKWNTIYSFLLIISGLNGDTKLSKEKEDEAFIRISSSTQSE